MDSKRPQLELVHSAPEKRREPAHRLRRISVSGGIEVYRADSENIGTVVSNSLHQAWALELEYRVALLGSGTPPEPIVARLGTAWHMQ